MSGALDPAIQQEIIERDLYATAVLSGNRNFDGRIHPYAKQAFLASPPLVVAYAIAGTIRFDIEKDCLGTDATGKPIRSRTSGRRDAEIDAVVASSVKPEQFRKVYEPMFAIQRRHRAEGEPAVRLARRRAPTSAGRRTGKARWPASARSRACDRWRCCGDNITTDHLSPSNAIMLDSAAGEYLAKMGLPEEDFNSYATHRGDHLTAQRATFANPTLKNEMVGGRRQGEAGFAGARRARRQGHAHVGSDRDLHGAQAAADHHCRRRLRPGFVARLGGQGRAPRGRRSDRRRRLRAHPPHQPGRHGRAAARVQAGRRTARRWASTAPRPTTSSANASRART